MTEAYEWRGRIGDVWAEEWRRTDRTLAPVNDALVAAAAAEAERFDRPRILDVGCGAGATSLALAAALAEAEIIGIDLSEALIAVARERAGDGADELRFEVADAAHWTPARAGFDLIVSRHGVMFFDDPVAAFAHLRTLAGADARLVFSCFRAPRRQSMGDGAAARSSNVSRPRRSPRPTRRPARSPSPIPHGSRRS